jgi:PKD repeat protein
MKALTHPNSSALPEETPLVKQTGTLATRLLRSIRPLLWVIPLTALLALPAVAAGPGEKPPFPEFRFKSRLQGGAAVTALGGHLPTVAAWYGLSEARFKDLLKKDPAAWIDPQGRLLFADRPHAEEAGASAPTDGGTDAPEPPYPLDQTFLLHSKPGAPRVIYLDFDGHTATGTAWNSTVPTINAAPYDLDGNPAAFGDAEKAAVQSIWQRVAEDYAPFDVDVTTQEPPAEALGRTNANDATYGIRVVVTVNSFGACNNGCSGTAYTGTFGLTSEYYEPAWVFYDLLGNGNEKHVAESIAHEAGHTLGLTHDGYYTDSTTTAPYYPGHGDGATGWAPIMGSGVLKEVTQWSKGEYASASNFQDDLAVIQTNGAPLRSDEVGGAPATAAPLNGTASLGDIAVDQSGLIESRADTDWFGFVTGGGAARFDIAPAQRGANLDIAATLFDAAGAVVATAAPEAELGASLSLTLAPGAYFLAIDGAGQGDPATDGYSDYASLGQYRITGSYPDSGWASPQAAATAAPGTGYAPLAVAFGSDGSGDPDGTIVAYYWNFGDGTTSTDPNPAHTYTAPGRYTATLTVTDSQGLKASQSVAVTVDPNPYLNTIHVHDIALKVNSFTGGYYQCVATVTVQKYGETPAGGAKLTGTWTGVGGTRTMTATANTSGIATLNGNKLRATGTCTFTATGVTLTNFTYDPAQNLETSASLTY